MRSPTVASSPLGPAVVRSPGIRMYLSIQSPSTAVPGSSSPILTSPHEEPISSTQGLSRRKKKQKLTSTIWDDFDPIYDANGILVEAKCKHCEEIFNAARDHGTSGCRRHLENCDGNSRLDRMLAQMGSSSHDDSLQDWKFDQAVARQELVKLIVTRELPFSLVEYHRFRSFCASLNPWFKEVSRTTIRSDCIKSHISNLRFALDKGFLLRKGKLMHCRCAAHVLNLIVQEGFKAISSATRNIRESVKYVKSSQGRKQRFEEIIEQVGIPSEERPPLDVATRWNSTYDMLKVALRYKRAFEALAPVDTQYVNKPSVEEWNMAEKLCKMLEVFSKATKAVSGSKYPTMNCYFHQLWNVKRMLEKESHNEDLVVSLMVHEMKQKFQKYWDLSFLKICIPIFLDPRFKLKFLEFRLKKGWNTGAHYFSVVEKAVKKLFAEYSSQMTSSVVESVHITTEEGADDDGSDSWADWGQHQRAQQMRSVSELDKYLEEETIPVDTDLDILQYWKMNATVYPILARMACDLFAVPASTVASESAFSTGERVISDYRSRLTSETIEALICLQDWIRSDDTNRDHIAGNTIGDDGDQI